MTMRACVKQLVGRAKWKQTRKRSSALGRKYNDYGEDLGGEFKLKGELEG